MTDGSPKSRLRLGHRREPAPPPFAARSTASVVGLAGAQDRAGDRDGSRRTLQQVIKTRWAARFGNVEQQAMQLLTPLSQPPR